PSAFACPECHGVLWELHDGHLVRFRCRVGHAFSPESLQAAQSENIEDTLWSAARALEEKAGFLRRMAERHPVGSRVSEYRKRANQASEHAGVLMEVLLEAKKAPPPRNGKDALSETKPGTKGKSPSPARK